LGGRDIWYDAILGRLNVDNRGKYLGSFDLDDTILVVFKDGSYEITGYDLTNRYEAEQVAVIDKFNPQAVVTALHYDANNKAHYVKRFVIETSTVGKKFSFIGEGRNSKLVLVTLESHPKLKLTIGSKKTGSIAKEYELSEFVDVRGWKAIGNKIADNDVLNAELLETEKAGEEIVTHIEKTKASSKSKTEPKAVFSSEEPDDVIKEPVKIAVKKADPIAAAAVEDVMEAAKEELEKKVAVSYAKKKTSSKEKTADVDNPQLKLF
jgi:topoisomerase IV subunit A